MFRTAIACVVLLAAGTAAAQQPAPSRGKLLYETHCIACHTEQMHWRTLHQARDWDTLRAQVRRWQATAGLGWPDADIDAVAGYLNESIYGFPRPAVASGSKP
jgi:mono/diheme cytochrome c family protein